MNQGLYVTGTDTGIGKTVVSCALLHALRAQGRTAVGMKPVASGCERLGGAWRNADALALIEAGSERFDYSLHNPYALPAATAPQLAARDAAITLTLAPILDAYRRIAAHADNVVVEGVGGWAAPLADGLDQADLVRALDVPVLLVVGLRLGCLSHARLSARAIQGDGCRLLGWIGSAVDPVLERSESYQQLLADALPVPCLGVLPHAPEASAYALASCLDVGAPL
jgi:dethiobiotin synthetase